MAGFSFFHVRVHLNLGASYTRLNTAALASYGPAAADHILCQEVGHILGLGPSNDLNSSMKNRSVLGSATRPNVHDATQLLAIYNYSIVEPDEDSGKWGPPCSKNPPHPNCQPAGRWGTVDVFPIPEENESAPREG